MESGGTKEDGWSGGEIERIASRRCGLRDHRWRLRKLPKGYSQFWGSIRNGTVDSTRKASRVITSRDHAVAHGSCRKELTARTSYGDGSTSPPPPESPRTDSKQDLILALQCKALHVSKTSRIPGSRDSFAKSPHQLVHLQNACSSKSQSRVHRGQNRTCQPGRLNLPDNDGDPYRTRESGAKYTSDCLYFMLRSSQELGQHC